VSTDPRWPPAAPIDGACLRAAAARGVPAVWVRVEAVRGSAPREVGASMLVDAEGRLAGTVGGGHLEHQAVAVARRMLLDGTRAQLRGFALGPSLGQCCGGSVRLSMRRIDAAETGWIEALAATDSAGVDRWLVTEPAAPGGLRTCLLAAAPEAVDRLAGYPAAAPGAIDPSVRHRAATPRDDRPGAPAMHGPRIVSCIRSVGWPVWVFGAGHVGEALVRVLATLPARITWVDPRASQFPPDPPPGVACLDSDSPAHEVRAIPPGADVLVMTHSHALDLDLCAALLARDDLARVGVIGSRTKAARFRAALARRGLATARIARLQCPIGAAVAAPGTRTDLDRHPGAIAVSVAFDLWQSRRAPARRPAPADG